MAISLANLQEWVGDSPPPFNGVVATVDLLEGATSVLRLTSRSVGSSGNSISVDVLEATSGSVTQRDIQVVHGGVQTYFINVDVSGANDNTAAVMTASGPEPFVTLSKLAAGTPDLATGLALAGGEDPRHSFSLSALIDNANALVESNRGFLAFFARNPQISRSGSWGQVYWDLDKTAMTQVEWDTMLSDLLAALGDPTE